MPFRLASVFVVLLAASISSGQQTLSQAASEPSQEITRLAQQAEDNLHNQKTALAVEDYRKILVLDPDNVQAHSNLGLAYYIKGEFAQASTQFEAALRLRPDLWETAALSGLSENRIGQGAIAKIHLQLAFDHVRQQKLRMAVGRQLFSILFEEGDLKGASNVVSELEELEPGNADVIYAAHQVYSLLANRAFLSLARQEPDSARMYQLRGDRMAQMGNTQGAIAAYRKALQRDPHVSGAHFTLGEILGSSRSTDERAHAEGEYRQALEDNPLDEKAECRLGDIDRESADLEGASQHYKRALQLQPDDPDANEGLGMVLLTSNSTQEARSYLSRAIQLDPTNVTAYYHLSQASRKAGDLDAAKREMDEFLKLKREKDKLQHTFDDLPLQVKRQTIQGQDDPTSPNSNSH